MKRRGKGGKGERKIRQHSWEKEMDIPLIWVMGDGLRNEDIIKDGSGGDRWGGTEERVNPGGGLPQWHAESLWTRSQLAIWKYAWGEAGGGQIRGQIRVGVGRGAVCMRWSGGGEQQQQKRGGCTLVYYYSPDLQSAWKVRSIPARAHCRSPTVIAGCI